MQLSEASGSSWVLKDHSKSKPSSDSSSDDNQVNEETLCNIELNDKKEKYMNKMDFEGAENG